MSEGDSCENRTFSPRLVGGTCVNISTWPTLDEGALEGEIRARYFSRKHAISLYLSGATDKTIREQTSLGAKQAYRLIRERCLETHSDGRPYGWRALIPYARMKPYTRRRAVRIDQFGHGGAGALQTILERHPELHVAFSARILARGSNKKLVETKRSKRSHWNWFVNQLRELGYEARQEWPFNTDSRSYYSVCRFVDRLLKANPKALAEATGGPDLVRKLKTGDGTNRPVSRFLQRVEMDAHKVDGRFCVSIPILGGGCQEKIIHRLWVIVILEVVSRAVVGYYLSLRREVSTDDVLRAIKRGLTRWKPRPISFCETPYLPGAGLLSVLGDGFEALCWDETSVDGALAETCIHVRDALQRAVGSALLDPKTSFSRRRSKDDRPFIEAFFRNLSGNGFQRMSNTTGSKPQDRKGKEPETVAVTSRFQYEYAEELLDVLIANYNATPHEGIGRRTPLSYANFLYQHSGLSFRHADRQVIDALFSVRKRCIVRGGAQAGRAPYVEFHYARYTNEVLQGRQDLVGSEIWVVAHLEDDGRVALASTLTGMSLGVLRAAPPWNISPHSLSVRSAIHKASNQGKFSIPAGCDAIEVFMNYVESHAQNKLPVHPAYLEVRRILVAAAETSIGASLLESAKARAMESEKQDGTSFVRPEGKPITNHSSAGQRGKPSTSSDLPPRRMTAVR